MNRPLRTLGLLGAVMVFATLVSCKPEKAVAVQRLTVTPAIVELEIGQSTKITVTIEPENAANTSLNWFSSNPAIATVADGSVTAVGAGSTVVTVTSVADDSKRATVAVTVKAEVPQDTTPKPPVPTELPRVAIISDTHIGRQLGILSTLKLIQALQHIISHGPLDALFIVGDLTDNGYGEQYDDLMRILNNQAYIPKNLPVYLMMGNHEYYNGLTESESRSLYLTKTGQPLHQYIEINGYPFITLSSSNGSAGPDANDYNDDAKSFLRDNLRSAASTFPDKPVFVLFHKPPVGTVVVSDRWGTPALPSILEPYPNVVAISGHLHYPLGDPRSIYQNKFTAIQENSTLDGELEEGVLSIGMYPENYEKVTEGIIMTVLDNGNVQIDRWDTYRDEPILPSWLIEAPFDGSRFTYRNRDGLPAPSFADGAKPTVGDITDDGSCTVTYPQATDDERVRNYLIDILDGTNVVASYSQFSQYFINSEMPAQLSATMTVPSGKQLTARVTAVDCFGNQSTPIVSEAFATTPYTPNPSTVAPVADLLNLVFAANGGANDVSPLNNTVIHGSSLPETYLNSDNNLWTAKFIGTTSCFYRVDYKNVTAVKEAFANGFSFELYYRPDKVGTTLCPMSATESAGAGFEQNPENNISFWIHLGGKYEIITGSTTVNSGVYQHIVATYDKTTGIVALYHNGQRVAYMTAEGNFDFPADEAQWIGIGGDATTGNYSQDPFTGEIAIARMYGKAVSRDEAYVMYQTVNSD